MCFSGPPRLMTSFSVASIGSSIRILEHHLWRCCLYSVLAFLNVQSNQITCIHTVLQLPTFLSGTATSRRKNLFRVLALYCISLTPAHCKVQ